MADKDYEEKLEKYFEKKGEEKEEEIRGITREYKIFKEGERGLRKSFYEKLCNFAGKLIPIKMPEDEKAELAEKLYLLDLEIEPQSTASLSILSLLFFLGLTVVLLLINPLLTIIGAIGAVVSYWYLRNLPDRLLKERKLKSSNQLVLATLYIVTYMRHAQNLENAIEFASKNLVGPLSRDFKKVLWNVQSKRFENIVASLDHYLEYWKDTSREFVDAMYLVESTLFQKKEKYRQELLDRAMDRVVEGTYRRMVDYAGELKNPISAIYMLGIVLPILGMVLFPMLVSVLSRMMDPRLLVLGYNVILPIFVFALVKNVLKKRPSGFPQPDIQERPGVPKEGHFILKGKSIPAIIPAILILIAGAIPSAWYAINNNLQTPKAMHIYVSLIATLATGIAVYVYTKLASFQKMKVLKKVYAIESGFAHGIFQLGSLLSQGMPAEKAIRKVATSTRGSETSEFFQLISTNMEKLGMGFERAIMDPERGAIRHFPSPIIKSSINVLVQTSKKSLKHAGTSMITLSRYLRKMQSIDDRVKEVLEETTSSMKFQVNLLAPVVSGVVIGLTAMITIIMDILAEKMTSISQLMQGGGAGMGAAPQMTFLTGIFQMSESTPLFVFQLMVGIYTIQVIILIAYTIANIKRVGSVVYRNHVISSMSLLPTIIYVVTSAAMTVVLTSLAGMTVGASQILVPGA